METTTKMTVQFAMSSYTMKTLMIAARTLTQEPKSLLVHAIVETMNSLQDLLISAVGGPFKDFMTVLAMI